MPLGAEVRGGPRTWGERSRWRVCYDTARAMAGGGPRWEDGLQTVGLGVRRDLPTVALCLTRGVALMVNIPIRGGAAFSICQTVGQRAAGECLLCIQEAHRAAEWPEVRASAVLLKRHLCLRHPLFPPRSQALSFPLLLLLLSSSSGLRRTAVSKCCDLMRGNLLDLMYKFARGSDSDKDNYIHIVV